MRHGLAHRRVTFLFTHPPSSRRWGLQNVCLQLTFGIKFESLGLGGRGEAPFDGSGLIASFAPPPFPYAKRSVHFVYILVNTLTYIITLAAQI